MLPALIVFAKAPRVGAVKTRLIPSLSPESACELHTAMVGDLLYRLRALRTSVALELHTDIPTRAWEMPDLRMRLQTSGDLGQRMYAALSGALEEGRPSVMILGSDSPTVPMTHLSTLLEAPSDVALGPATDGGYYAISCRRAGGSMFDGVIWSASTTCQDTAKAMRGCGLTVELGPEWYDVDTPADLRRLCEDPNLGDATRAVLQSIRR